MKQNFYSLHADICKTIANSNRQAIIDALRDKELTVSELIKKTGISQANLSQHLAILRTKGVVNSRREGNNIFYSIANIKILQAYDLISEVLRENFNIKNKEISEAINIHI